MSRWARWRRPLIGLGLFVLAIVLVTRSQREIGVVRDETFYFAAGTRYADWWLAAASGKPGTTSEKTITAVWGGAPGGASNSEHPPLMKTLFGLSEQLFHDRLGVASETTAYRLPTVIVAALLLVIVFAWVSAVWGEAEGVVAALLTLFLPRAYFHAGLACFDAPIVTFWVATLYAYWRGLRSGWWALAAGLLWGLALATKHNALFLPLAIAPHFVWIAVRAHRPTTRGPLWWLVAIGRELRARWLVPVALIALGPATLIALWPWLWFDTWAHASAWIRFHSEHVHYNFEYLGHNWNHPTGRAPVGWYPWHVPIVTTLLTVPVATLAAALLGAGVAVRDAVRGKAPQAETAPGLLLALGLLASMAPFVAGLAPIFGAEKHWGPAIPSLCVAAGIGVVWAARRAASLALTLRWSEPWRHKAERGAIALVALVVIGAAAIETRHAQPYALSQYNALAGGAPGGADLGMNRQFWGYASKGVIPWLRTQAPGPVYSHDGSLAWNRYLREGLLPRGFEDSGPEERGIAASRYALVIHERHFNRHDYLIWTAYGTVRPAYVLRVDGVPIVSVYARSRAPE